MKKIFKGVTFAVAMFLACLMGKTEAKATETVNPMVVANDVIANAPVAVPEIAVTEQTVIAPVKKLNKKSRSGCPVCKTAEAHMMHMNMLAMNPEVPIDDAMLMATLEDSVANINVEDSAVEDNDIAILEEDIQAVAPEDTDSVFEEAVTTEPLIDVAAVEEVLPVEPLVPEISDELAMVVESTVAETPIVEITVAEVSAVDAPVIEAPVVEVSTVDMPVIEVPVVEAPVADMPIVEVPVVEAPAVDMPVIEAPAADVPAIETPSTDALVIVEPVIEEPKADEAVVIEPLVVSEKIPEKQVEVQEAIPVQSPAISIDYNNVDITQNYTKVIPELGELYRLVESEAGIEDAECKAMVAGVVLNRVASERFPNSIHSVIYAPGAFTVAKTNAINRVKVTQETIEMVNSVYFNFKDVPDNIVFFRNKHYFGGWCKPEFSMGNTYFSSLKK